MQIIDTHQHLWDLNLFRFSWLESVPVLNRSFGIEDYLRAATQSNVVQSVHIEADVDEEFMLDETRHIFRLAEDSANLLTGVVACARPERDDFHEYLAKIVDQPRLKGIRRVLHTQADPVSQNRVFLENVSSLAAYNLSFDICVLARQLPIAIDLVSRCPEVTFILDHCGVPRIKEKVLDPWRSHIKELAGFPKVICKISGIAAYADPQNWTAEDLRPYVEHVIDCFGWDRVMFGSDWPVCTLAGSLPQWIDALKLITQGAGKENQKKLFYDNAMRVYRLSDPSYSS